MVVFNLNPALWWAVIGGFVLNLFSALPFGTLAIAFALAVAITHKLFIRFFTNRSLYSLIFLTAVGAVIFKIIAVVLSFAPVVLGDGMQIYYFNFNFIKKFLALVAANVFVVSIMFFTTNLFSKRLKPVYVSIRNSAARRKF
jgi:cell shape-determining protein MreD